MKVKCTINKDDQWFAYLTIDKIYNTEEVTESDYYQNHYTFYQKEWFKTISEIRNEKINKLLE